MVFLAGKPPNIWLYTGVLYGIFGREIAKSPNIWLYTGVFYDIFGREIAKHMVVHRCFLWYYWQGNRQTYGCTPVFSMVFLAGKSPNIWLYTGVFYGIFGREIARHMIVHRCFIWYFWQGNRQTYGCTPVFSMEFLAGKSPTIWLYTV